MKKRLQVYISPEADALLREKANADKRSISATIDVLIFSATEENCNEDGQAHYHKLDRGNPA